MRRLLTLGLVLAALPLATTSAAEQRPATIPELIRDLSSKDIAIRLHAARQLSYLGLAAREAVPPLGKLLRDPQPEVRVMAAKALGRIGTPAVPALIEALKDPSVKIHSQIAEALAWIGPPAKEAVPALTELLKTRWDPVRIEALIALGEIGAESSSALPTVVRLLDDPNKRLREQAVLTVAQIGQRAVPVLKDVLEDKSLTLRLEAMRALALFGPNAKEAMPVLIPALKDKDPQIQAQAAATLGRMGKEAKDAVPFLLDALQDKRVKVQIQAALALVDMASQGIPGLLDKIREADRKGGWAEPVILKQFGKNAVENVKTLTARLQDRNPNVRANAIMALTVFGLAARPAMPALTKALQDENESVRLLAAVVLLRLDPTHKEALKLVEALRGVVPAVQPARAGQRPLEAALEDPVIQARYDRIIHIFLVMAINTIGLHCVPLERKMGPILKHIDAFPPEAVPALVRGMNQIATHQLGFC